MKIVIQCAAQKQPGAGRMRTADGRSVFFVAHPSRVDSNDGAVYAHPDEPCGEGRTWRDHLLAHNESPKGNPLGLLPAYRLYRNQAYQALAQAMGVGNLFILSAGWGLIPGSFLTPDYDITFSSSAGPAKRRTRRDSFKDLRILDTANDDPIVFFGGKDYFPLFSELTDHYRGRRVAIYNSQSQPQAEGVECVLFETTARTNWHYQAVKAFLSGEFDPLLAPKSGASGRRHPGHRVKNTFRG